MPLRGTHAGKVLNPQVPRVLGTEARAWHMPGKYATPGPAPGLLLP